MSVFFLMVAAAVAMRLYNLGADAFVLPSTNCCSSRWLHHHHHRTITINTSLMPLLRKLALSVHDGDNLTEQSVKDMEALIVSLSKEPTDETRRERVQKIFDDKLQKGTGGSSSSENAQQFFNLFDQVLIVVGDRTREKAAALQLAAAKNDNHEPAAAQAGEKSDAERQVWALVDMMVQSKMIVKRASS